MTGFIDLYLLDHLFVSLSVDVLSTNRRPCTAPPFVDLRQACAPVVKPSPNRKIHWVHRGSQDFGHHWHYASAYHLASRQEISRHFTRRPIVDIEVHKGFFSGDLPTHHQVTSSQPYSPSPPSLLLLVLCLHLEPSLTSPARRYPISIVSHSFHTPLQLVLPLLLHAPHSYLYPQTHPSNPCLVQPILPHKFSSCDCTNNHHTIASVVTTAFHLT